MDITLSGATALRFIIFSLPFGELFSLLLLADTIGLGATLLELLASGLLGLWILKRSGRRLGEIFQVFRQQSTPSLKQLFRSLGYFIAGVSLCIPGLLTDTIGLIILLQATLQGPWRPHPDHQGTSNKAGPHTLEGEFEIRDETPSQIRRDER